MRRDSSMTCSLAHFILIIFINIDDLSRSRNFLTERVNPRGAAMNQGLDDVVAAETVLSHVDGAGGRLIVRGFELQEIAERSFEAVVALLWNGLTPHPSTEEAVRIALGAARPTAFAAVGRLLTATDRLSPVEGLRASL